MKEVKEYLSVLNKLKRIISPCRESLVFHEFLLNTCMICPFPSLLSLANSQEATLPSLLDVVEVLLLCVVLNAVLTGRYLVSDKVAWPQREGITGGSAFRGTLRV